MASISSYLFLYSIGLRKENNNKLKDFEWKNKYYAQWK